MKHQYKFLLFLVLTLFVSCQTNKIPKWLNNPPKDDRNHIYFVGYGNPTSDMSETKEDLAISSVVRQLAKRYEIVDDKNIESIFLHLLKDSYVLGKKAAKRDVTIADRWENDTELYVLAKIKKEFINSFMESYALAKELEVSPSEFENSGDEYFNKGEVYKAYKNYLLAADEMLKKRDETLIFPIIRVLDKALNILEVMKFTDTETFSEMYVNDSAYSRDNDKPNRRLFFRVIGVEGGDYSGFNYNISFSEGWDMRSRKTVVALRDSSLEFIPPVPKKSGIYTIGSTLNMDESFKILKRWEGGSSVSYYIGSIIKVINRLVGESKITFNYTVKPDINIRPKLISFNNPLTTDGVVKFLQEMDELVEPAPVHNEKDDLKNYIRELNKDTDDAFGYLVLGEVESVKVESYEGALLYRLKGEFSIIDLRTSFTVVTQKIESEFIGTSGEEEIAYIDLGLKIGEVVSQLKF